MHGHCMFTRPHPPTSFTEISFPEPRVILVTLSRPLSLNCMNFASHEELEAVWNWFDDEPSLRVAIITGQGRAFCVGADLKEWNAAPQVSRPGSLPQSGFGGLSSRSGKKPIIAAVNGLCFGGGCEMIINTDLVLASRDASFSLPEVKHGVIAVAGALPRLVRTVGKQRAMEMALTGRTLTAEEAREWGLVNKVVHTDVLEEAVRWAVQITLNSPDSVIVSKEGVRIGWEGIDVQEGTEKLRNGLYAQMNMGENMKEGLKAFAEKRKPIWINSKL